MTTVLARIQELAHKKRTGELNATHIYLGEAEIRAARAASKDYLQTIIDLPIMRGQVQFMGFHLIPVGLPSYFGYGVITELDPIEKVREQV